MPSIISPIPRAMSPTIPMSNTVKLACRTITFFFLFILLERHAHFSAEAQRGFLMFFFSFPVFFFVFSVIMIPHFAISFSWLFFETGKRRNYRWLHCICGSITFGSLLFFLIIWEHQQVILRLYSCASGRLFFGRGGRGGRFSLLSWDLSKFVCQSVRVSCYRLAQYSSRHLLYHP